MGKYYQIGTILIFYLICLSSQVWAWLLGVALISPLILHLLRTKKMSNLILLSTLGITIAWSTHSYFLIAIWSILILWERVIREDLYPQSLKGILASVLFLVACIIYNSNIIGLAYILLLYMIPLPTHLARFTYSRSRWKTYAVWILGVYILIQGFPKERRSAYLHHGVWARSESKYDLDSLNNLSGYSYSLFVEAIKADTISHLDNIGSYTELWIVTPTQPFSSKELSTLKKWVTEGGHLFLVTDHTDLYGHARVSNQVATLFGATIRNTALFRNGDDSPFFSDSWGGTINIKTGTGVSGRILFPLATSYLWEEVAYYSCPNFFGPLSASGDDNFGIKILAGQIPWGMGQITLIQDSTIYANFAIFQPGILSFVNALINSRFIAWIYLLLPIFFILLLKADRTIDSIPLSILCLCCLPTSWIKNNINYGNNPQIWTGDKTAVVENGCPYKDISTAFAVSPLSGRIPVWKENLSPSEEKDVIYVGELPPPSSHWRWIKISDSHKDSHMASSWNSLGEVISTCNIDSISSESREFIEAKQRINDRVFGDFWFNNGISIAKRHHFSKWLKWLNPEYKHTYVAPFLVRGTEKLYDALLYIAKEEPIPLKLPRPTTISSGQLYLGNGISAEVFLQKDTLSLVGYKAYQLNSKAPDIWVIDYLEPYP